MKKKVLLIEIIISIISFFVCLINNPLNGYKILYILPLTYLILRTLLNNSINYKNIGCVFLDILTFIKYSIMPLLIVIMKDYYAGFLTKQIPISNDIELSILLILGECITIFICIYLYNLIKNKNEYSNSYNKIKFGPIMFILYTLFIILLIFNLNLYLPQQFLVINGTYNRLIILNTISKIIKKIFYFVNLFTLLYLTQYYLNKYNKYKKNKYIILILITLLIYLGLNTSTSRWNLVIPVIIYTYLLKDIIFKTLKNKIVIFIGISILSLSFISITLYKFDYIFNNNKISNKNIVVILCGQLQEYFSGPRTVAQSLEMTTYYKEYINYETLSNDFLGQIPIVSNKINSNNKINIYYNYFLKGKKSKPTQIIPMVSVGYIYFDFPICYIFTIIVTLLTLIIGNSLIKSNNIFHKYINTYLCFWLSMGIGLNHQILFRWFIATYIPFNIIYYLNNKIK